LEKIGEGGFSVVFRAEQQHPVRRKVALKVLKPGMDTRQVVARFEAERQALALMDHPNIAKVLDGGETAGGRPYFVMELVKGAPITEHCDQNRLTPRERHKLRIATNKFRYTSELFGSLFNEEDLRKFVGKLKRLQDDLGYANDVRVAHDFVTELFAQTDPRSPAAHAWIGVPTKRIRECVGRNLAVRVFRKPPRRNSPQARARIGGKNTSEKNRTFVAVVSSDLRAGMTQRLKKCAGVHDGRSVLDRVLHGVRDAFLVVICHDLRLRMHI